MDPFSSIGHSGPEDIIFKQKLLSKEEVHKPKMLSDNSPLEIISSAFIQVTTSPPKEETVSINQPDHVQKKSSFEKPKKKITFALQLTPISASRNEDKGINSTGKSKLPLLHTTSSSREPSPRGSSTHSRSTSRESSPHRISTHTRRISRESSPQGLSPSRSTSLESSPRGTSPHNPSISREPSPRNLNILPTAVNFSIESSSQTPESLSPRINSLSESSPRSKEKAKYKEKAIPELDGFDWANTTKYDSDLRANIKKLLIEFKSEMYSTQNPANHIPQYCTHKMYEFFHKSDMNVEQLSANKDSLIDRMFKELQDPFIILKSALPRLKKVLQLAHRHHLLFGKTSFSSELYFHINQILKSKTIDEVLAIFKKLDSSAESLKSYIPLIGHSHLECKEVIYSCLGRFTIEINDVLELLKKWGPGRNVIELKTAIEEIFDSKKKIVEELCQKENKLISYSTIIDRTIITKITPKDIERSFFLNNEVIFKQFTITGRTISIIMDNKSSKEVNKNDHRYHYFFNLFKTTYMQGLDPQISDASIKEQTKKFLKELDKEPEKDNQEKITIIATQDLQTQKDYEQEYKKKEAENLKKLIEGQLKLEKEIPCLKVIKLGTINCLGTGTTHFFERHPDLSSSKSKKENSPFYLKFDSGIIGRERIYSDCIYEVEQIREAFVCLWEDNSKVASLKFSWTVKPESQLIGIVKIYSTTMINIDYIKQVMDIFHSEK